MINLPCLKELMEAERWISQLDSLVDGAEAMEKLIDCGQRSVIYLERFLFAPPRSIAIPRCRAAHALGVLGAWRVLIAYFKRYREPENPVLLFAEDAVRSTAASELALCRTEQAFQALLDATRQRATSGLVSALGSYRRAESIPLLFEILEDDLCRDNARVELKKMPDESHQYAILSVRGRTRTVLVGVAVRRRLRAVLQLLEELGTTTEELQDLRQFLLDADPDIVIAVASISFCVGTIADKQASVDALLRVSDHLNWLQEEQVTRLLDENLELVWDPVTRVANVLRAHGEKPDWTKAMWRILGHILNKFGQKKPHVLR